jgi:exopolysaccharide production protein ExoZ
LSEAGEPPGTSAQTSAFRLDGLDALRGLLALAVAAYHLSVWFGVFPSGSQANMTLAKLGNYGVAAFFMLSGFLLFRLSPWEKVARQGVGRFYLKRCLRLAPIFYLAVLLNLSFRLGMGPGPSWRMAAENFTLVFGAIHPNHALVTGGWYVGLVALCYAAYPAIAWAQSRVGPLFIFAVFAALIAWSLPATLYGVPGSPQWARFHAYVLPGNQLFLLAGGGLLGVLHQRLAWRPQPWMSMSVSLGGLALLLWNSPRFYDHFDVLTGWIRYRCMGLVALILVAASLWTPRPGILGRVLGQLGALSYGIYLLHPFAHRLVAQRFEGRTAFLLALALAILAGAAAERWIERPLAKLVR